MYIPPYTLYVCIIKYINKPCFNYPAPALPVGAGLHTFLFSISRAGITYSKINIITVCVHGSFWVIA